MIKYLFFVLGSIVVENAAFLTTNTALELTAKNNPVLMRLLQTVDAATTDERLLDVSLQLLKSLCVCMRETLKAKQVESLSFSGDTNSLQAEDDTKDPTRKVLDIYQNIYNKTCFDLKNEVASKVNKSAKISSDEEKDFMLRSDCGKTPIQAITHIHDTQSHLTRINKDDARLEDILYQTFIKTRNYHRYRTRKYSLYKATEKQMRGPSKHNIIVILTFYPSDDRSPSINNCTKLTDSLAKTLLTHSPIDIDIIDARFGQKENVSEESLLPKEATDCTLKSIYTFLLHSEKNNTTKVFKLMRRSNTIKVYIDVTSGPNHSDYTKTCCNNRTDVPLCKIEFSHESFDSKEITTHLSTVEKPNYFKDTISKIKSLVIMYDKKLKKKKFKRLTTQPVKRNMEKNNSLIEDKNNKITKNIEIEQKKMAENPLKFNSTSSLLMNDVGSKELWMNSIADSNHEKYQMYKIYTTKTNKQQEAATLYNNLFKNSFLFLKEAYAKQRTSTENSNVQDKNGNIVKPRSTTAGYTPHMSGMLDSINQDTDTTESIDKAENDNTYREQISDLWQLVTNQLKSQSTNENMKNRNEETITTLNFPIENTLEIVVTANDKQKNLTFDELFAEPNFNEVNQKPKTVSEVITTNKENILRTSRSPYSKTSLFSICISLSKNTHHTNSSSDKSAKNKATYSTKINNNDTFTVKDAIKIINSETSTHLNNVIKLRTTPNKSNTPIQESEIVEMSSLVLEPQSQTSSEIPIADSIPTNNLPSMPSIRDNVHNDLELQKVKSNCVKHTERATEKSYDATSNIMYDTLADYVLTSRSDDFKKLTKNNNDLKKPWSLAKVDPHSPLTASTNERETGTTGKLTTIYSKQTGTGHNATIMTQLNEILPRLEEITELKKIQNTTVAIEAVLSENKTNNLIDMLNVSSILLDQHQNTNSPVTENENKYFEALYSAKTKPFSNPDVTKPTTTLDSGTDVSDGKYRTEKRDSMTNEDVLTLSEHIRTPASNILTDKDQYQTHPVQYNTSLNQSKTKSDMKVHEVNHTNDQSTASSETESYTTKTNEITYTLYSNTDFQSKYKYTSAKNISKTNTYNGSSVELSKTKKINLAMFNTNAMSATAASKIPACMNTGTNHNYTTYNIEKFNDMTTEVNNHVIVKKYEDLKDNTYETTKKKDVKKHDETFDTDKTVIKTESDIDGHPIISKTLNETKKININSKNYGISTEFLQTLMKSNETKVNLLDAGSAKDNSYIPKTSNVTNIGQNQEKQINTIKYISSIGLAQNILHNTMNSLSSFENKTEHTIVKSSSGINILELLNTTTELAFGTPTDDHFTVSVVNGDIEKEMKFTNLSKRPIVTNKSTSINVFNASISCCNESKGFAYSAKPYRQNENEYITITTQNIFENVNSSNFTRHNYMDPIATVSQSMYDSKSYTLKDSLIGALNINSQVNELFDKMSYTTNQHTNSQLGDQNVSSKNYHFHNLKSIKDNIPTRIEKQNGTDSKHEALKLTEGFKINSSHVTLRNHKNKSVNVISTLIPTQTIENTEFKSQIPVTPYSSLGTLNSALVELFNSKSNKHDESKETLKTSKKHMQNQKPPNIEVTTPISSGVGRNYDPEVSVFKEALTAATDTNSQVNEIFDSLLSTTNVLPNSLINTAKSGEIALNVFETNKEDNRNILGPIVDDLKTEPLNFFEISSSHTSTKSYPPNQYTNEKHDISIVSDVIHVLPETTLDTNNSAFLGELNKNYNNLDVLTQLSDDVKFSTGALKDNSSITNKDRTLVTNDFRSSVDPRVDAFKYSITNPIDINSQIYDIFDNISQATNKYPSSHPIDKTDSFKVTNSNIFKTRKDKTPIILNAAVSNVKPTIFLTFNANSSTNPYSQPIQRENKSDYINIPHIKESIDQDNISVLPETTQDTLTFGFDTNSSNLHKSQEKLYSTVPIYENVTRHLYNFGNLNNYTINNIWKTTETATTSVFDSNIDAPNYSPIKHFNNNSVLIEILNRTPYTTNQYLNSQMGDKSANTHKLQTGMLAIPIHEKIKKDLIVNQNTFSDQSEIFEEFTKSYLNDQSPETTKDKLRDNKYSISKIDNNFSYGTTTSVRKSESVSRLDTNEHWLHNVFNNASYLYDASKNKSYTSKPYFETDNIASSNMVDYLKASELNSVKTESTNSVVIQNDFSIASIANEIIETIKNESPILQIKKDVPFKSTFSNSLLWPNISHNTKLFNASENESTATGLFSNGYVNSFNSVTLPETVDQTLNGSKKNASKPMVNEVFVVHSKIHSLTDKFISTTESYTQSQFHDKTVEIYEPFRTDSLQSQEYKSTQKKKPHITRPFDYLSHLDMLSKIKKILRNEHKLKNSLDKTLKSTQTENSIMDQFANSNLYVLKPNAGQAPKINETLTTSDSEHKLINSSVKILESTQTDNSTMDQFANSDLDVFKPNTDQTPKMNETLTTSDSINEDLKYSHTNVFDIKSLFIIKPYQQSQSKNKTNDILFTTAQFNVSKLNKLKTGNNNIIKSDTDSNNMLKTTLQVNNSVSPSPAVGIHSEVNILSTNITYPPTHQLRTDEGTVSIKLTYNINNVPKSISDISHATIIPKAVNLDALKSSNSNVLGDRLSSNLLVTTNNYSQTDKKYSNFNTTGVNEVGTGLTTVLKTFNESVISNATGQKNKLDTILTKSKKKLTNFGTIDLSSERHYLIPGMSDVTKRYLKYKDQDISYDVKVPLITYNPNIPDINANTSRIRFSSPFETEVAKMIPRSTIGFTSTTINEIQVTSDDLYNESLNLNSFLHSSHSPSYTSAISSMINKTKEVTKRDMKSINLSRTYPDKPNLLLEDDFTSISSGIQLNSRSVHRKVNDAKHVQHAADINSSSQVMGTMSGSDNNSVVSSMPNTVKEIYVNNDNEVNHISTERYKVPFIRTDDNKQAYARISNDYNHYFGTNDYISNAKHYPSITPITTTSYSVTQKIVDDIKIYPSAITPKSLFMEHLFDSTLDDTRSYPANAINDITANMKFQSKISKSPSIIASIPPTYDDSIISKKNDDNKNKIENDDNLKTSKTITKNILADDLSNYTSSGIIANISDQNKLLDLLKEHVNVVKPREFFNNDDIIANTSHIVENHKETTAFVTHFTQPAKIPFTIENKMQEMKYISSIKNGSIYSNAGGSGRKQEKKVNPSEHDRDITPAPATIPKSRLSTASMTQIRKDLIVSKMVAKGKETIQDGSTVTEMAQSTESLKPLLTQVSDDYSPGTAIFHFRNENVIDDKKYQGENKITTCEEDILKPLTNNADKTFSKILEKVIVNNDIVVNKLPDDVHKYSIIRDRHFNLSSSTTPYSTNQQEDNSDDLKDEFNNIGGTESSKNVNATSKQFLNQVTTFNLPYQLATAGNVNQDRKVNTVTRKSTNTTEALERNRKKNLSSLNNITHQTTINSQKAKETEQDSTIKLVGINYTSGITNRNSNTMLSNYLTDPYTKITKYFRTTNSIDRKAYAVTVNSIEINNFPNDEKNVTTSILNKNLIEEYFTKPGITKIFEGQRSDRRTNYESNNISRTLIGELLNTKEQPLQKNTIAVSMRKPFGDSLVGYNAPIVIKNMSKFTNPLHFKAPKILEMDNKFNDSIKSNSSMSRLPDNFTLAIDNERNTDFIKNLDKGKLTYNTILNGNELTISTESPSIGEFVTSDPLLKVMSYPSYKTNEDKTAYNIKFTSLPRVGSVLVPNLTHPKVTTEVLGKNLRIKNVVGVSDTIDTLPINETLKSKATNNFYIHDFDIHSNTINNNLQQNFNPSNKIRYDKDIIPDNNTNVNGKNDSYVAHNILNNISTIMGNVSKNTSNNTERIENKLIKKSTKTLHLNYKTNKKVQILKYWNKTTSLVPIIIKKKNKHIVLVNNTPVQRKKIGLEQNDHDDDVFYTKTLFIVNRSMESSFAANSLNKIKAKVSFEANVNKKLKDTKPETTNNVSSSLVNDTRIAFITNIATHPTDIAQSKRMFVSTLKYLEPPAEDSDKNTVISSNVTSKPNFKDLKSIVYNTYKALTEEELTLPPDVRKIITTFSTIYTKGMNRSNQDVKLKASKLNIKKMKSGFKPRLSTGNTIQKFNKSKLENEYVNPFVNDTLQLYRKTYLHPIENLPIETQRKSFNRINLKNRKSAIMAMNTKDFLSFRRAVTRRGSMPKILKPHPMPVPKHLIKVNKMPRRLILRPKFNSLEDFKKNPAVDPAMPNHIIMPDDNDFYKTSFKIHHKPIESWKEKIDDVRTKLEPQRRSDSIRVGQSKDFEPVIDLPYYMPARTKPYFLRDKVESVRSYIYNEEKNPVNTRKHFRSPPKVETSGVAVDAADSQEHLYYSAGTSREQVTDQSSPRAVRPKKTIFFLSPTIPYNRYF